MRALGALALLAVALSWGCDFSDTAGSSTDGGGTDGGGTTPPTDVLTSPILFGVEPGLFCVGESVNLQGVNFNQQDLSKNRVNFIVGTSRVPGLPIGVESLTDGNPANGVEMRLRVLVPGGVSPGGVELLVDGVYAGAFGYGACPQIMAWSLAANSQGRFLRHQGPLGFEPPSYIRLYGVGFTEIQEVILEDSTGVEGRIYPNTIERNPGAGNQVPNGYSSIGFNLHDDATGNNIQLPISTTRRDIVKVQVRTTAGLSNVVEIPVINTQNVTLTRLGAAINAVKLPTGVVTGPVRIYYNLYDLLDEIGNAYKMEVDWTVDGGETWFPAAYDVTDPLGSGASGVQPGTLFHPSRYRLFPTGGAARVFTWDAPNDTNFRNLNTPKPGQATPPRDWTVAFRLRPVPLGTQVRPFNFTTITPSILYSNLEDRSADDAIAADRSRTFIETFLGNGLENPLLTDASWGPDNNPDALVGVKLVPPTKPSPFGTGTVDLKLRNVAQEDLPPGIVGQFFLIDTDQMQIQQIFVDDAGTPGDPADDIEVATELLGEGTNPGHTRREFHVRRFLVCPDAALVVVGANPVIVRSSGFDETPEDDATDACVQEFPEGTMFGMGPGTVLNVSGGDGQPSAAAAAGAGGYGLAGGGAGGAGGQLTVGAGATPAAIGEPTSHGADGGNDGGLGGETMGGFDADATANTSIRGGSGGGGGHRLFGGAGDTGKTAPSTFQGAKSGLGGVARGDRTQRYLTAGSGGGGGGAGLIYNVQAVTYTANPGAGGGGGGGAVEVVANGHVSIDPAASIQANGGAGGSSATGMTASGAGGGGSGGSIVLRAAGSVVVDCASLQVKGGLHGTATQSNLLPGSGDGAPGWIRLESGEGGAPNCAVLAAETSLARNVSATENKTIEVLAGGTASFPDRGTIVIDSEEIAYQRLGDAGNTFEVLVRTGPVTHQSGAKVYLKGAIAPYSDPSVWVEGKILPSPDVRLVGRARDGELDLRFEPGIDPETGETTVDPDTGETLAIYEFDTDLGTVRNPAGNTILNVASAEDDPGFLDLSRLRIGQGAVLRGKGSRPMRISVSGEAEVSGRIDASGYAGGLLIFPNGSPEYPLPGPGGAGGPGGAQGGAGGRTVFLNGDVDDKAASNVVAVHGAAAQPLPGTPAYFDETPVPYGDGAPGDEVTPGVGYTRALPGRSLAAQDCGGGGQPPCLTSAGGGGGGGANKSGTNGTSIFLMDDLGGSGGSPFGLPGFRWDGSPWPFGAGGGGGGGSSPQVSAEYRAGQIGGSYLFKGKARYAPGTGGGGGGGAIILVATDIVLRQTAMILARGGDAYQSIDLGGNGGGGAGGNVFIHAKRTFTFEQGAAIDVSGGRANRALPREPGLTVQRYEGNYRASGTSGNLTTYGGMGGAGSSGRVRIEADLGSQALQGGRNSSVTSGPSYLDTVSTQAVSRPVLLGVGRGGVARSFRDAIDPAIVKYFEFGQPVGTESVVLWEGARESLDMHGGQDTMLQRVRDPNTLRYTEFVRFFVRFESSKTTGEAQTIDEIRLPYRYPGR